MKIKLFKESFKKEDYYIELHPQIEPGASWWHWLDTFDYSSFTSSLLKEIKSILGSKYKEVPKLQAELIRENQYVYQYTGLIFRVARYSNYTYITCDIIMLSDEWFLVRYRNYTYKMDFNHLDEEKYFKCDQLDGLIKFLQDYIDGEI